MKSSLSSFASAGHVKGYGPVKQMHEQTSALTCTISTVRKNNKLQYIISKIQPCNQGYWVLFQPLRLFI